MEELKEAIKNGTVTLDDALNEGWITKNDLTVVDKSKVTAKDKPTSNMIGEFETTILDGTVFSNKNLNPITYFAFIDPNSEVAAQSISILSENYETIKNADGDVLIFSLDDENTAVFTNTNIPVVFYNDSVKFALGDMASMINEDGFIGTWNVAGAFPMSWSIKVEADDNFIDTLNALKDKMSQNTEGGNIENATVVD